jgi:glycine cleavage system H protein
MRLHSYEFPDDLYYSAALDTWARPDASGWVTIGVTSLGVALAGEIVAFLPVRSPISGAIMETNRRLESSSGTISRDPYGDGWLLRMLAAAWDRESAGLVYGDAVAAALKQALENYRGLGYDV